MSIIVNPNGGTFELTEEQKLKQLNIEEFIAELFMVDPLAPVFLQEAIRYYATIIDQAPVNVEVQPTEDMSKISSAKWREIANTVITKMNLKYGE